MKMTQHLSEEAYTGCLFLIAQVMDVLNLAEILKKHIVKRCTKDARDILPGHLVHYYKDEAMNQSFLAGTPHYTYKRWILLEWVMRVQKRSIACRGHESTNAELCSFGREEGWARF